MVDRLQRWLTRWLYVGLVVSITMSFWCISPQHASARIIQEQLKPGVVLDKSLRTLRDGNGYSWQAIAFQYVRDGDPEGVYLRLVGFPGAVSLDRTHPMLVSAPSGQVVALDDVSYLIFKDGKPPQPNVAQYALDDVLKQVQLPTTLRLALPIVAPATESSSLDASEVSQLELRIPRAVVEEWVAIAHPSPNQS